VQHRALGTALVLVEVEVQLVHAQHPVGLAAVLGLAAAVAGVVGVQALRVVEVDARGPSPAWVLPKKKVGSVTVPALVSRCSWAAVPV
jgi:hypothetical protein